MSVLIDFVGHTSTELADTEEVCRVCRLAKHRAAFQSVPVEVIVNGPLPLHITEVSEQEFLTLVFGVCRDCAGGGA